MTISQSNQILFHFSFYARIKINRIMCNNENVLETIKKHIKTYPDFPKKGIVFRDIFSVLLKPTIFAQLKDEIIGAVRTIQPPIECVVGMDARGFLFGPIIALEFGVPFVPIRKKGKLPGKVIEYSYLLEYGQATIEIQEDAIKPNQRVLIIDDLLATGGTLNAACKVIEKLSGVVVKCLVIIELAELKGREKISNFDVLSLVKF